MAQSKSVLLPYQRAWVEDKSPLKIWKKARQIGFSFASTFRCVTDMVRRKTLWIALSAGQRQSIELAQKAKEHVEAIARIESAARGFEYVEKEYWGAVDYEVNGIVLGKVDITQSVIHFPSNKSRMIFLPANPDTARGYSGNVLADEFAFHRDAKKIYAAIYPSVTRGHCIEIGSTCFGESGMFYELCEKKNGFSKHCTTIYDAVAQGLKANIKTLRDGCPDDDIWEQEYECKFLSSASSWITWEQIQAASAVDSTVINISRDGDLQAAMEEIRAAMLRYPMPMGATCFMGGDIARKRDLTIYWPLYVFPELGISMTPFVVSMRGRKFKEQRSIAEFLMDGLGVRRLCQDSTGIGAQLAEEMQDKYGANRVEPVNFTFQVKEDLATRTRRRFEDGAIKIPDDRNVHAGIHAVKKFPTAAGHFRYDSARTDAGHADEFWSLSLSFMAAEGAPACAYSSSDTELIPASRANVARAMMGERERIDMGIRERERRAW
jgi:phage FluMu gp28-like protein